MASTYLTRTFGSAGNRQSWTWSAWIKKSKIYNSTSSGDREVWFGGYTASNDTEWLEFGTQGDAFYFTTSVTASTGNRLMRDPNGWFHAVVTYDGSNLKFYYNNELDFNNTQLSGNRGINVAGVHTIGALATNQSSRRFNGVMSHVHFVDGAVLAPTVFGETDSVTGEWKIIVEPTVSSYGTNGFFILKDGNSVTDQSTNSNNWTVAGGTLTKTEDNPSNVFCTINPLDNYYGGGTLSNGNTKIQTGGSGIESYTLSTLGASSGKYYCEMKLVSSTSAHKTRLGIAYEPTNTTSDFLGKKNSSWSYNQTGEVTNNNSSVGGTWSSYTAGDIIGMAFNLDDLQGGLHKLYYSKNGVWQNGADPSNHSSTTGVVGITADKTYLIGIGDETGGYSVCELNFGNGYFGTTAVSSAGTNASGNGIFEYDVPTGFTALSTKGLNL